jgi:hypothetical protein
MLVPLEWGKLPVPLVTYMGSVLPQFHRKTGIDRFGIVRTMCGRYYFSLTDVSSILGIDLEDDDIDYEVYQLFERERETDIHSVAYVFKDLSMYSSRYNRGTCSDRMCSNYYGMRLWEPNLRQFVSIDVAIKLLSIPTNVVLKWEKLKNRIAKSREDIELEEITLSYLFNNYTRLESKRKVSWKVIAEGMNKPSIPKDTRAIPLYGEDLAILTKMIAREWLPTFSPDEIEPPVSQLYFTKKEYLENELLITNSTGQDRRRPIIREEILQTIYPKPDKRVGRPPKIPTRAIFGVSDDEPTILDYSRYCQTTSAPMVIKIPYWKNTMVSQVFYGGIYDHYFINPWIATGVYDLPNRFAYCRNLKGGIYQYWFQIRYALPYGMRSIFPEFKNDYVMDIEPEEAVYFLKLRVLAYIFIFETPPKEIILLAGSENDPYTIVITNLRQKLWDKLAEHPLLQGLVSTMDEASITQYKLEVENDPENAPKQVPTKYHIGFHAFPDPEEAYGPTDKTFYGNELERLLIVEKDGKKVYDPSRYFFYFCCQRGEISKFAPTKQAVDRIRETVLTVLADNMDAWMFEFRKLD